VVVICGTVLVFVGLFFLLPKNPEKVYRNGLSKIEQYVDRLLGSSNDGAGIVISEANGSNAVSIMRKGRSVSLFVVSHMGLKPKIESFFAEHAIKAIRGASLAAKGMEDDVCQYEFPSGTDPKVNSQLIRSLFTDLFGVDTSMSLMFTEINL